MRNLSLGGFDFVMENRHKQMLKEKFNETLSKKAIIVLNIEDNYQYMDEELIGILRASVGPYLE